MAYRTYFPLRGVNFHEPVAFALSFTPDLNTSYPHAVTLTAGNGAKFSVSKTAAGTYVVTFTDPYLYCVASQADYTGSKPLATAVTGKALNIQLTQYASNSVTIKLYDPTAALVSGDVTTVEPYAIPTGAVINMLAVFKLTKSPN